MNNNLVVEKIDVPDVDSFLSKIADFFKKQIVLTIAIIAMTITCFLFPLTGSTWPILTGRLWPLCTVPWL